MKCRHCGTNISEGALFCDYCGQPVRELSLEETTIKKFWNEENSKKKDDLISDLAGLKGRSAGIQDVIVRGKKLKAKRSFFRLMLLLFLALVGVVSYTGYQIYEMGIESFTNLFIASAFTLVLHLLFLTFATIVANSGALKILYLLIPVFGYLYFLYSFACGLIRMFSPLKNEEKVYVRDMKKNKTKYRLLKKEEKSLKNGLNIIDKGLLKSNALKDLKDPIVEKKTTCGWKVTSIITIIILAIAFVAFQYVAQVLIDSGSWIL